MACAKEKIQCLFSLLLIIIYTKRITATNINCSGKPFHCVNLTHFMICVDLGGGVSKTVDDFVIPCPPTTVCRPSNNFECEYQIPTTSELMFQGNETTHFEVDTKMTSIWNELTTEVPPFQQTTEIFGESSNTVSPTTPADMRTETQTRNSNTIADVTIMSTQVDETLSTSDKGLNYSDIFTYEASEVEMITSSPTINDSFKNDTRKSLKISTNEGLKEDAVVTIATLSSIINNITPMVPDTLGYKTTTDPIREKINSYISEDLLQNTTVSDSIINETEKINSGTNLVNFHYSLSTALKDEVTESSLSSLATLPDLVTVAENIKEITTETSTATTLQKDAKTTSALIHDQMTTESILFDKAYLNPITIYDLDLMKAVSLTDKIDFITESTPTSANTLIDTEKLQTSQDQTTTEINILNYFHTKNTEQPTISTDSLLPSALINSTNLPSLLTDVAEVTRVTDVTVQKPPEDTYNTSITVNTESSLHFEPITDNHILNIENLSTSSSSVSENVVTKSDLYVTVPTTVQVSEVKVIEEVPTEGITPTSTESWQYQTFLATNMPIDSYTFSTDEMLKKEKTAALVNEEYTTIRDITTNVPGPEKVTLIKISQKNITDTSLLNDRSSIGVKPELNPQYETTTKTTLMENKEKNMQVDKNSYMNTQYISPPGKNVFEPELFTVPTSASVTKPYLIIKETQELSNTENNEMLSTDGIIKNEISTQSLISVTTINTAASPEYTESPILNKSDYFSSTNMLIENAENVTEGNIIQEPVTETVTTSIDNNIYQDNDQTAMMNDVKPNRDDIAFNFGNMNSPTTIIETNQVQVEKESFPGKNNGSINMDKIFNNIEEINKTLSLQYPNVGDTYSTTSMPTTSHDFKNTLRTDGVLEINNILFNYTNQNISNEFVEAYSTKETLETTFTWWGITEETVPSIALNNSEKNNDTLEFNHIRFSDQPVTKSHKTISRDIQNEVSLNSTQLIEIPLTTDRVSVTATVLENGYTTSVNRSDSLDILSNMVSDKVRNSLYFNATTHIKGKMRTTSDSATEMISFENQGIAEVNLSTGSSITEKNDENIVRMISVSPINTPVFVDSNNIVKVNDNHLSTVSEPSAIYLDKNILGDITNAAYDTFNSRAMEKVQSTYTTKLYQDYENSDKNTSYDQLPSDILKNINTNANKNIGSTLLETKTDITAINDSKYILESHQVAGQQNTGEYVNNTNMTVGKKFEDTAQNANQQIKSGPLNVLTNFSTYDKHEQNNFNKIESQDFYKNTNNESMHGINLTNLIIPDVTLLQQKEFDVFTAGYVSTIPSEHITDHKFVSKATETISHTQNNVDNPVATQRTTLKNNNSNNSFNNTSNESTTRFSNKVVDTLSQDINMKRYIPESEIRNDTYDLSNRTDNNTLISNEMYDSNDTTSKANVDFNTSLDTTTPPSAGKMFSNNDNNFVTSGSNRNEDSGNIYVGNKVDVVINMLFESGSKNTKQLFNSTVHELQNIHNNVVKLNSSNDQKADQIELQGPDNLDIEVAIKFKPTSAASNATNSYDSITQQSASFKNGSHLPKINNRRIMTNNTKFVRKYDINQNDVNSTKLNNAKTNNGIKTELNQNTTDHVDFKRNNITIPLLTNFVTKNATTNNTLISCHRRLRGRYADKSDCSKFYICIGIIQPLFGKCPAHTVFSEIKKQCTKNLSHCIRNNQFYCLKEGRFSDPLRKNIYYVCLRNNDSYVRFQFQCQGGYYLNKTSVRCAKEFNNKVSSISNDSDSNRAQSTVEHNSKEKRESKFSAESFTCRQEGKFPILNDCRRYYICSKNSKSVFRRKIKKCDSDEVFHKEKKKCVDEDSYEC